MVNKDISEKYSALRIRDTHVVRPAAVLAPMAGVTDTVFRRLIRGFGGCGLLMTEFTSADGVTRDRRRAQRYLSFEEDEHPIAAQLFGANPDTLAEAAAMCEELGFDQVDLNLGCPAKKVVKCGGSGLLRDLPVLGQILRRLRAAVSIPFTLKFRSGWDENSVVVCEVGRMAEDCGVEAIALHPRTRAQGYSGRADWTLIAELKGTVSIPVIGNGDINSPEDAERMFRETGCDAVMIGRAAAANPWIFRQMEDYFASGSYSQPSQQDRHWLIREICRRLMAADDPETIGKVKQFASRFTHSVPGGARLRKAIFESQRPEEILERVEEFFGRVTGTGEPAFELAGSVRS